MKAKHFKKMRANLYNLKWLKRKLREIAKEEQENEHFYNFECSEFFRGEKLAELNKEIYYRRKHNINRRYRFIETKITACKVADNWEKQGLLDGLIK